MRDDAVSIGAGPASASVRSLSCALCPARPVSLCRRIERRELERLFPHGPRMERFAAGSPLFRQGEPFDRILLLRTGWVSVDRLYENGRRQIVRFALAGDLIGFEGDDDAAMAYGAEAVTDVTACAVDRADFFRVCGQSPDLAMSFAAMVKHEALSAWNHVGALGQQSAEGRVANLLLDLHQRVTARGDIGRGGRARLPLNQIHIADATGLTSVHVCRTLKRMKAERLLEYHRGELVLLDPDRLAELAQLDSNNHAAPAGTVDQPTGHRWSVQS